MSVSGTITPETGGNDGAIIISPTGGTLGYTFLWSNAGITQNISGLVGGVYTVTITDANGCTVSGSFTVPSTVGIENLSEINVYSTYPNPSNGIFNISFSTSVDTPKEMKLINSIGQVIHQSVIKETNQRFDFSFLPAGNYLIGISDGKNISHVQIVIR
jgi:hypothetical protein